MDFLNSLFAALGFFAQTEEIIQPGLTISTDEQIGAGPGAFFSAFAAVLLLGLILLDFARRVRNNRYKRQAYLKLREEYGFDLDEYL